MNTEFVKLPALSSRIYKEWVRKTVLVQSCDDSYAGELNLQTRELDIPIYHDISVHLTSIKEREAKPAAIEFIKSSTKRVTIDKGRYSHWGQTTIGNLINELSADDSQVRAKLVNLWAREAETELAEWVAFDLPAVHKLDMVAALAWSTTGYLQAGSTPNVLAFLDVLKAKAIANKMSPEDFTLFISERFESVARDAKLVVEGLPNEVTFRTGSVGVINGVDVRKIQIPELTTRNADSGLVEAEYAIWKTHDGIQYVVPFKNTITYDIQPTEILMGGKGYQTVEYYDFFNIYPTRLYRVPVYYKANPNLPTKA